jgi:hypothetical protein
MADKRISELTALTGANVADTDLLPIVDTSAAETKKITFAEFKTALDTATGFVRITGDTMTGDLSFGDNNKAIFGAGSDLQIFHDGGNSYINDVSGTGALFIKSNQFIVKNAAGTENVAVFNEDTDVRLFYNSAIKLATTATGIDVTGVITTDGMTTSADINFGDNDKAIFGAGSDLQIYHNGSDSFITDTGAGNLQIWGGNFRLRSSDGSEAVIDGNSGGAVTLYYDNAAKLATTATGISVTGTVVADGLTVDGQQVVNFTSNIAGTTRNLLLTNTNVASGNRAGLYFQPSNGIATSYIDGLAEGDASTTAARDGGIVFGTRLDGTFYDRAKIASTGDISFYEDTGTTAKFYWDSSAEALGLGTATPSAKLDIFDSTTGNAELAGIKLVNYDYGVGETGQAISIEGGVRNDGGGISPLGKIVFGKDADYSSAGNRDGNIKFYTNLSNSVAERMRIDSSGNVGIGTSSPSSQLEVSGSAGPLLKVTSTASGTPTAFVYSSANGADFGSLTNHPARIYVNNSERMRIDSSGNVGIGTSSPSAGYRVHAVSPSGTNVIASTSSNASGVTTYMQANASISGVFGTLTNHPQVFVTNNTERMRIDSSGNLIVGGTSAAEAGALTVYPTGIVQARVIGANAIIADRTSSDGEIIDLRKDGTTVGSIGTEVTDVTLQADLYVHARSTADGSTLNDSRLWLLGGDSGIVLDGYTNAILPTDENSYEDNRTNIGSSDYRFKDLYLSGGVSNPAAGGTLTFGTVGTERMRIDASGIVLVGKTSSDATAGGTEGIELHQNGGLQAVRTSNNAGLFGRKGTDGSAVLFRKDTTTVGSISITGSATAYNTSSDYRLKTDAQPMTGASDRVLALKPVNFEWISSGERVDGFLAHEAQAIVPECVTGTKDAMRDEEYEVTAAVEATYDEDGNELTAAVPAVMGTRSVPDMQGIDQSKLVPLLTAALQEALTKIADMEIRLSALEG